LPPRNRSALSRKAFEAFPSSVFVPSGSIRRLAASLTLLLLAPSLSFSDKAPSPTDGFTIELPNSEKDVLAAVQIVADDHIVRGTYVYERERTLTEAVAEKSSSHFGSWKGEGYCFYKVRREALAPRNFKNSSDIGVITVRYVVHATSATTTHLEILAVFVEDGTNRVHPSNSTVETSEFAEIQKQLLSIQNDRQMALEIREKKKLEEQAAAARVQQQAQETVLRQAAELSLEGLERRADELQHALEVRLPNPNTELKAAPFHGAGTLTKLPANIDVLVEIVTTYWYGIETPDGHRGWVRRDQAVALP
jgi:hypothetical protein